MKVGRREAIRTLGCSALGSVLQAHQALEPGLCGSPAVTGYEPFCFTDSANGRHQVYVAEGGGPSILLLHELPGLIDADLATGTRLQQRGFRVVAPLLFGEPGGAGDWRRAYRRHCGVDQFACGKANITSPHVTWLRELCAATYAKWNDGKGVGVIGMCLTGAFPLPMLREPSVVAAVLCQPTVPFNAFTRLGWFTDKRGLGVHPDDVAYARTQRDVPLLGIRYTDDWRSRRQRFERLVDEFKDRFYRMDICGAHHSTLGDGFCAEAFVEVDAFFNRFLRSEPLTTVDAFPRRSVANSRAEVQIERCGTHHE